MSSRDEPIIPDGCGADRLAEHEALVARARVLIADPAYPTSAIVEELARILLLQSAASNRRN